MPGFVRILKTEPDMIPSTRREGLVQVEGFPLRAVVVANLPAYGEGVAESAVQVEIDAVLVNLPLVEDVV